MDVLKSGDPEPKAVGHCRLQKAVVLELKTAGQEPEDAGLEPDTEDQKPEVAGQEPEAEDQVPDRLVTEAAVQVTLALYGVVWKLLIPEVVLPVKAKAAGPTEAAERKQAWASMATSMVL